MDNKSVLFPGFHRAGLGRKPASEAAKLAKQVRLLDAMSLAHLSALIGHALPDSLTQWKPLKGANSRARVFTPMLCFWAFLSQVLDVEGSCRRALARVQALVAGKGLPAISDDTGAYCKARLRLPIRLLYQVLHHVTDLLQRTCGQFGDTARWLVFDGTSLTLQDTDENRAVYPYPSGQSEGCGFPVMKMLGLFDLTSGACLKIARATAASPNAHDAILAERVMCCVRPGDTVVADRAFCSYKLLSLLVAKGAHAIMRLHQARAKVLARSGSQQRDEVQTWTRPKASKGQTKAQHEALPATLRVRIITRQIERRGWRAKPMHFVTTLLDAKLFPAEQIVAGYGRRWNVELFFDDLKTSQKAAMLRTKSPPMVARELLMHLIVYNLVRLLMAQAEPKRAAEEQGRLSYRGTLDRVSTWHPALWGSSSVKRADEAKQRLLELIAKDPVIPRPGRREPRVIKKRPKNFPLMTKPRKLLRTIPEEKRSTHRADKIPAVAA